MGFIAGYVRIVGKLWPLVMLFWIGLLIFGCIRGPHFLLNTDNEVAETAGTPSARANAVLNSVYDLSLYTPWVVVAQCPNQVPTDLSRGCDGDKDTPVLGPNTKKLFDEVVVALKNEHPEVFAWSKTNSWFSFDGTPADSLKSNFISDDGRVTYLQLAGLRNVTQAIRFQAYHTLQKLLPKLESKYCKNCVHVGVTGGDSLTDDVATGLAHQLIRTNLVIIPIAAVILVYMVGNWRLLLITLFNVAVVVLGTFAISDTICNFWVRPQSITAQMIEVISVAITIDYSLFLFTRFIQELNVKRKRWSIRRHHYFKTVTSDITSPNDVFVPPHLQNRPQPGQDYFGIVFDLSLDSEHDPHPGMSNPSRELLLSSLISTVEHSGHVVLVSGVTLLISFAGFIISRCVFLIQPAIFTALGVLLAILTSLSTSIALIQAFPSFFTDFNFLPQFMYSCCKERRKTQLFDTDFTDDFIFIEDPDELSYQAAVQNAELHSANSPNRFQSHNSFQYANDNNNNNGFPGAINDRNNKFSDRTQLISTNGGNYGTSDGPTLTSSPSQVVAFKGQTKDVSTIVDIPAFHKSLSYRFGRFFVKFPWSIIIVLLTFGIMGFFSYFVSEIELTSAYALGIPRDSTALATLHVVEQSFPPGVIQPIYILMRWTPPQADPQNPVQPEAGNDLMFERGNELLKTLSTVTKIDPSFTRSPFYWDGKYIPDTDSTPFDAGYVGMFLETSKGNTTQITYMITLLSPISPDSPELVPIIRDIRSDVTEVLTKKYKDDSSNLTEYFLTGYKVQEQDTIDKTEATFPLMLSITFIVVIAIVAILLKSAFVPIRLILTLALPLACTFGLTVLVFQKGWLGWTGLRIFNPEIKQIYWELPPFCAVVLLSLALDYDVFIISRIIEHRVNNFSNPSSILLALYETSSVITSAGIIMVLTFSGLFFMQSDALAQLGFILVVSVLLDCFVTRTIIVPCVFSVGDRIAYWPRKVNYKGLRHYDGTPAD